VSGMMQLERCSEHCVSCATKLCIFCQHSSVFCDAGYLDCDCSPLLEGFHAAIGRPMCHHPGHTAGKPPISSIHSKEGSNWQPCTAMERRKSICCVSILSKLLNPVVVWSQTIAHDTVP